MAEKQEYVLESPAGNEYRTYDVSYRSRLVGEGYVDKTGQSPQPQTPASPPAGGSSRTSATASTENKTTDTKSGDSTKQ